jgi:predicted nucleic acid-binding protein
VTRAAGDRYEHPGQRVARDHIAAGASHRALARRLAGRLINEIRDIAVVVQNLPSIAVCADPFDNYLLAIAVAGAADFLVTGDKRDLLRLKLHEGARIITVHDFLTMTGRLP